MKRECYCFWILWLAVLLGGCNNSVPGPTLFENQGAPAFMYASNEGEIRFLNVDIVDSDTTFTVTRFSNIGRNVNQFGRVNTDVDFKLDWSPFDTLGNPRVAAVLRRDNPLHQSNLGPANSFFHQVVSISDNKRISSLSYFSRATGQQRVINNPNQTSGGFAKAVSYVNQNTFLTYQVDRIDDPLDEDPFKAVGLVLRFTFNPNDTFEGEIVQSFNVSNAAIRDDSLETANLPFKFPNDTKITSSANGEFYVVWASLPPFDFTRQPYIIRQNGTFAAEPSKFTPKDFRNVPGIITNQYEPHPTRDSLFAVVDYSTPFANGSETNGFHVLKLGLSKDEWLTPLYSLDPDRVLLNNNLLPFAEIWQKRSMFISYSPLGDRIAILYALSSESASLVVWFPEEDRTERFTIDPSRDITTVRKPAWFAKDPSLLFFTAADSVADVANIYFVNTDNNGGQARRLDWDDDIEFFNLPPDDDLREAREMVGRKDPF